ncbi:tRNA (5-methylaminomethyl-2-thiouridine)(34)-methyltransferase MnmD [Mucilaginibacter sp. AK015]|uniref:tRNA (5-methylaminomethyl-2-thiouridine)(34)-methyltransferase MnmD n=1 Tax=Mucilaginibacter sp. AK015 TaxID=2723072 RepID=UPI001610A11E|nr:tRNA (5-methylaminomethyl-2-thiouridine)(34)-methyltransferase MnmD [Mucilaginibacter sp. AK015]MBB5395540.1 tRNA U34 5-methylaminomethyl-2-thiouridine-forming methyltransferase MnmC [Mucilaginibacter sp. AK015]
MSTDPSVSHLQIVPTADGSNTIYNAVVGENYHSRNGALQESRHVFVEAGLQYFLKNSGTGDKAVSVLEVGFGTGLNFLLTADFCTQQQISLRYTGIEAYPLTNEMVGQTGYNQYVPAPIWQGFLQNYDASLQGTVQLNHDVQLHIAACSLLGFSSAAEYDVIYFDAFAAAHQPEMWSQEAIAHTLNFLKPGGIFVTYAITGNLKRIIKALGLKVQKVPGAPGKREMLRAVNGL